jgi:formate hydrogenlyase subunit 3/multisubunit Na+/H+ antiporter MnhD subunit
MALPSWGLISHSRTPAARSAARVYLAVTVVSEMFLLAALMLGASVAGSTNLAEMRDAVSASPLAGLVIALVLASAALKIGSLVFNGILPLTYTYTPTGAAAALAGASVKVGALALLRLLPLGTEALSQWGVACIVAGLATAVLAAILGVLTTLPKAVLGYSSASQMGLLLAAVGAGLAGDAAAASGAVVAYSIHHGFAKASLFLGEDIASSASGRNRRIALAALLLPALALTGAPFTSGFAAKYALYGALYYVSGPFGDVARALLPWAAVGTSALMARVLLLVAAAPVGGTRETPVNESRFGSNAGIRVAVWVFSLLLVASATWLWPAPWAADAAEHALELGSLWAAIWPVLVVAGITLALSAVGRASYPGRLIPGDWMVLLDPLMLRIGTQPKPRVRERAPRTADLFGWAREAESLLTMWIVAGSVFILLAVALTLLVVR